MARPKLIDDDVLIDLIKKYFNEECKGNIKKLKYTEIVKYINANGYPNYPASTLRRTPVAMNYIDELKSITNNEHYVTAVSYQTIDAALLVDSNRSRDSLVKAITERDNYYKMIADSAAQIFERYKTLAKKYENEVNSRKELEITIAESNARELEIKTQMKELKEELKAYKSIVDTYVYPEIANELLVKDGAIRQTKEIIKPDILEQDIITPITDIRVAAKSKSNIIEGLFKLGDQP